jgi:hypothetical protein
MSKKDIYRSVKLAVDSDLQLKDKLGSVNFEFWKSLSNDDRDFLLSLIEQSRNVEIIRAFNEQRDISIKYLGTFKIKQGRKLGVKLRKEKLAELGYANEQQVDVDIIRTIKKETRDAVLNAAISRRILRKETNGNMYLGKLVIVGKSQI